MSINKVILVGNVGNDPEVQYVMENVPVARFRLATSENYKNKSGERVTNTEWHNVVVWRGLATVVEKYVKKGMKLYIEGKISYRKYEKDGQVQYYTDIVADEMKMLDSKSSDSGSSPQGQASKTVSQNQAPALSSVAPDLSSDLNEIDDLPF
jgi:single-strand DNA-binding protein